MKAEIVKRDGYDFVKFLLKYNEEVYSQPGALMYFKGDIEVETKSFGGILTGIKRSIFGSESFFMNKFRARVPTEIAFSPSLPGAISVLNIGDNESYYVSDRAYLCHYGDILVNTKLFGLKGIFSSSGMFWLNISGRGYTFLNVFGSVEELDLQGDEVIVDNYNVLAFSSNLDVELIKLGGIKSFLFGGEGFMFKLSGYGKVLIQTRNIASFAYDILRYNTK